MSKTRKRTANWKVFLLLLVCFPYGLYRMWRTTRWHPALKGLVTLFVVALVGAVALPMTSPPVISPGGVRLVGAQREAEVYGPELPASMDTNFSGYGIQTSSQGPVFAEEDSSASIPYVYANENGKYYHKLNCKYVAFYSVQMTIPVAFYSGYAPCQECGAEPFTLGE